MNNEKVIELTKALIKYRTVRSGNVASSDSEPNKINFEKEINDCINFVRSSLHHSIIVDNAEGYVEDPTCPITIAKFQDTKEPDLLIIGHIDVVAGEDSQFIPFEQDGKIYGRGSKDMKAGIAAMIEIMNHYAEQEMKPNIAIAIVSDEESGGFKGANLIANKMGYNPKFVITPDPGERHCIINKEKGLIWFTITAFGKSSHPSRPWLGDSAYEKIFCIWKEIAEKFNLAKGEDDWKSSASLLEINKLFQNVDGTYSSDTSASVAGIVKCRIDIRYTENDNVEIIKLQLYEIVKKYDEKGKIEFGHIAPVVYTSEKNELLKRFKSAVDLVEQIDVPILASSGASDMRFFSEKNIPCVNYGPTGKNHHAKNEFVEINSLRSFCKTIINYVDASYSK